MTDEKNLPHKFKDLKPFEDRLRDGELCDVHTAARLTGYSEQHIRRLCADDELPHIRRNDSQYFFEPEHIKAVFKKHDALGLTD
mgnify:CR=1 FL=1